MQNLVRFFSLLATLSLLAGCATSYQPSGFGGGYSEMALNQDTYIVSFNGNGFTGEGTVQSYLLRRCAELTQNKGYKYFVVVTGKTSVDTAIMQTPTTVNVNSSSNYSGYGYGNTNYYGNSAYSDFNVTGSGSSSSYATINPGTQYQVNKYTSRVIVKMFKSNKNLPQALDAKVVLSNFQDK
ncbi:MAG: hypothetical protein A3F14_02255 [Gammaproteobacteria bacterium RIFCSPHIGHO2_12_FULL_43_28]|nr:MAG: hypothetical protein A3F14_02255 [Gammaproteobacteria bacterium RIFCSPHIGHO2_12_FULL_43_28]